MVSDSLHKSFHRRDTANSLVRIKTTASLPTKTNLCHKNVSVACIGDDSSAIRGEFYNLNAAGR